MIDRTALERDVLALACRGLLTLAEIQRAPMLAFTSEARLLAWTCAEHVARLGDRATFDRVREALGRVPSLGLPAQVWAQLLSETGEEIDRAEAQEVDDAAYAVLLDVEAT